MITTALIVAGGTGERFGRDGGKQTAPLAGSTVVMHTIGVFDRCAEVDAIVVVTRADTIAALAEATSPLAKVVSVVEGGDTRQRSVAAGLAALPAGTDIVIVHDGARPLVTPEVIGEAVRALGPSVDGVVVGHPSYDTVKVVDGEGFVTATADRSTLWVAQTPQVFRASALVSAHDRSLAEGFTGTDDAMLVERAGGRVRMLAGPRENLKVTVPGDLVIAEAVLRARGETL